MFPARPSSNSDSWMGQKWTIKVTESLLMWRTTASEYRRHLKWILLRSQNLKRNKEDGRCQSTMQRSNWQLRAESSEIKGVTHYIRRTPNYKMMCGCFVGHVENRHWVSSGEFWEKICSVSHDKPGHCFHSHLIQLMLKWKKNSLLICSCC